MPLPSGLLPIGVSIGVRPSSLLLGQGCDEFAAELRDVWDHTAPDQLRGDREMLGSSPRGLLG